jgi:hypothetical protein
VTIISARLREVQERLRELATQRLDRRIARAAVTFATNSWNHPALYAQSGYGYVGIDQTAVERL